MILEGDFLGVAKIFLGGAVLGNSFPSLYIVHQGEMNTKIFKKKSVSAEGLARPAFLHLRVQYLVATSVCQIKITE